MTLGIAVALIGFMGMIGWIRNIPILTTVLNGDAVSMKLSAAIALVLCGFSLAASGIGLCVIATIAAMTSGMLLASMMIGFFGAPEPDPGTYTVWASQMPSVATMFCITSFASAMVYRAMADVLAMRCTASRIVGVTIIGMAALALVGYAIDRPELFYYVPPVSTGMAFPSAMAILAMGGGLLMLPGTGRTP